MDAALRQRTEVAGNDLVATLNRHRLLLLLQLRKTPGDNQLAIDREAAACTRHVEDLVHRERRARQSLADLLLIETVASNMAPGRYRSEVERLARTGLGLTPAPHGAPMAVPPHDSRTTRPPDHREPS